MAALPHRTSRPQTRVAVSSPSPHAPFQARLPREPHFANNERLLTSYEPGLAKIRCNSRYI